MLEVMTPCLAALFLSLADDAPPPAPYCHTFEDWATRLPADAPAGDECPSQGVCDDPVLRDSFAIGGDTPMRWIKLHLLVFRNDDGSDPAATPEEVADQLAVMNEDYVPWRIQFSTTWEYIDDTRYRSLSGGQERDDMKTKYAVNPESQCNMFITGFGGGLGTFPWDPRALTALGGIVNGGTFFSEQHHVVTHEMGHNLGLWHTHHGVDEVGQCGPCYERPDGERGDETGDYCSDTPPRPVDFGLCGPPGTNDPCSGLPWGETQPENYMSYGSGTGIECWELFTPMQGARMHCWGQDVLLSWLDCDVGDDCNGNGVSDRCDIRDGTSDDANGNWIPDECEGVVGDVNGDGLVNFEDVLDILAVWGPCPGCPEDLSGNDIVGLEDVLIVLANWSR